MSKKKNGPPIRGRRAHIKEFLREFDALQRTHDRHRVFSDLLEMTAYAISNSIDPVRRDARELKYLTIINSYATIDERSTFPALYARTVLALDDDFGDFLGHVWEELELSNKWRGQYFTPEHMCQAMAEMTLGDDKALEALIEKEGFITMCEPCCGSGRMAFAAAEAMLKRGINFQQKAHFTLVDVDYRCAWMAYIQASLLGLPAVVQVGDVLAGTVSDTFVTPLHVMGGWSGKLRFKRATEAARELLALPAPSDTPADGLAVPLPVETRLPTAAE